VLVGSVAYLVSYTIEHLSKWMRDPVRDLVQSGSIAHGYLLHSVWAIGLSLVAALLTLWAPQAAGSGIPHVKSFLNGCRLDGIFSFRTLIAKVIGISLCVTSGMPAGREGPMVHTGAIIASVVSELSALWTRKFDFDFTNDYDHRNFVSMGAAAGVAAAFNAPIGGTLFALEEVSSFWNPRLTMLTFCIVTVAALTSSFWVSGLHGRFEKHGLVTFAESAADAGGSATLEQTIQDALQSHDPQAQLVNIIRQGGGGSGSSSGGALLCVSDSSFAVWELLPFMCMGVVAGLMGAVFNESSERVNRARKKFYKVRKLTARFKVGEAVLSVWLCLSIYFWLPFLFGCSSTEDFVSELHTHAHGVQPVAWQCTGEDEYNELATMLLSPPEGAIIQLFSRNSAGYFSPASALAFTTLYFVTTAVIFGLAVPSGLFVPAILIGGGMGRFLGEALHQLDVDSTIDPGVYALMGAAGVLGGVTRMTMSLSMIVAEVSGDLNLLLPAMLVVVTARLVAERFNESIYLIQIKLGAVPLLDPDDVDSYHLLNVKAVMATKVYTLQVSETLTNIVTALDLTEHNGFPLVDEVGRERGSVRDRRLSKDQWQSISSISDISSISGKGRPSRRNSTEATGGSSSVPMMRPVSSSRGSNPAGDERSRSPEGQRNSEGPRQSFAGIITREQLENALATAGISTPEKRNEARTSEALGMRLVDLRPHCDSMPFIVNELLPLRRAFRLFQTMGLRHLCVVDHTSCLVGILTRKDFLNVNALGHSGMRTAIRRRRASLMRFLEEENRPAEPPAPEKEPEDKPSDEDGPKREGPLNKLLRGRRHSSANCIQPAAGAGTLGSMRRSWSWGTRRDRRPSWVEAPVGDHGERRSSSSRRRPKTRLRVNPASSSTLIKDATAPTAADEGLSVDRRLSKAQGREKSTEELSGTSPGVLRKMSSPTPRNRSRTTSPKRGAAPTAALTGGSEKGMP